MGKTYPEIDEELRHFMQPQPVFFVATAPLDADGHVNLSPKGLDTFRILGPRSVAYLDGGNGIQDERWNGTLEQIFAVPTPLWVILLGKVAGSVLFGLLAFIPTAVFAYVGFHALLPHIDALRFAISLGVLTLSFLAIAITLTPLFALWRTAFNMLNGFELGIYVLCGFMFPATIIAPWAQGVGDALAPTWATRALYASTTTDGPHEYVAWWLAAIALSSSRLIWPGPPVPPWRRPRATRA